MVVTGEDALEFQDDLADKDPFQMGPRWTEMTKIPATYKPPYV
jgi:hypothetical protein